MAAPKPTPRVSFISEWRAADLSYGRRLLARGLLSEHRLSWRDPTCQDCGHRAWDHGLENLPIQEQHRWFNEEATACQWAQCGCATWRPYLYPKHPVEYAGQVLVADTWIEVPLGRSWVAAYRIVDDRGAPVVGELRIFPEEEGRPGLGRWSGDLVGTHAKVPRRGITLRQLRGVRVRTYQRYMAEQIERLRAMGPVLAKHYGWDLVGVPAKRATPITPGARRGRKGRPDQFYALVAADYSDAITRGSHRPVMDVAKRRSLPGGQVRDMIRQARKRGLLTREGPGLSGGTLTERALKFLPRHQKAARLRPSRSARPSAFPGDRLPLTRRERLGPS